jgi:hypothetical protein
MTANTEPTTRVRLRDSRTIHATRLSTDRRVWTACGRTVSTSIGDEMVRGEPDVTCPRCTHALALAAETFWPPQVGDVWLGQIADPVPVAFTCTEARWLRSDQEWDAEQAYETFGPLRLVWRDGAVVTAMHSSELPDNDGSGRLDAMAEFESMLGQLAAEGLSIPAAEVLRLFRLAMAARELAGR